MIKDSAIPESGLMACWKSPSNIAIIKYWGKTGRQIPLNASLSFTLTNAYTHTRMSVKPLQSPVGKPEVHFTFDGKINPEFAVRIESFLSGIAGEISFLSHAVLNIESSNTFPHSAGIASSASAMSALALCLCDIEQQLSGHTISDEQMLQKASIIARLGSGSACRSVYGGINVWGKHESVPGSDDAFSIPLSENVHADFHNIQDTIFIVDPGSKAVSSSAGHRLMDGHPFAEARFVQASDNLKLLVTALEQGDWDSFIRITENEALSLHAMMMTSNPGFLLMQPETITIIRRIQEFRKQTGAKVCFTLDAGPNVHMIYAKEDQDKVFPLVEALQTLCADHSLLQDEMGQGPEKLTCN